MENNQTFSQGHYKKLIINNGGKILIFFIILFYLVPTLRSESANYFIGVTYIIVAVIILFIFTNYKIKRFIHEIEISFYICSVVLNTYRSIEIIKASFDDLIINKKFGCLIFNYRNKKFIYNGEINDELTNCVNRIMNERISARQRGHPLKDLCQ